MPFPSTCVTAGVRVSERMCVREREKERERERERPKQARAHVQAEKRKYLPQRDAVSRSSFPDHVWPRKWLRTTLETRGKLCHKHSDATEYHKQRR